MFSAIHVHPGRKNYVKVDGNDDDVWPFCVSFKMGESEVRVHMTAAELENLFFEVNVALQEFDKRRVEEQLGGL